jgi:hypothetical protein
MTSNQVTHHIAGWKSRFLPVPEVRNTRNVASLPETSTFVIRLHLPKCRQNMKWFNLEHIKPHKRTHKYHISLQIRTDVCFECRSFPPLKTCTYPTIFRERHATLSSTAYRHSIWVKQIKPTSNIHLTKAVIWEIRTRKSTKKCSHVLGLFRNRKSHAIKRDQHLHSYYLSKGGKRTQIPPSVRNFKYRKCGIFPHVATLPEWLYFNSVILSFISW